MFLVDVIILSSLQEIHSLPTKITDGLNSVSNYRRNIDGTKYIIFSTFLLPFTDRIPTENYRQVPFTDSLPTEYLWKITDGSVPYVIFALYVGANL